MAKPFSLQISERAAEEIETIRDFSEQKKKGLGSWV